MIDRIFGGVVALLVLLFLLVAVPTISDEWRTGVGAQYFTIGPRFFPYIAGALCLLFSILIAVFPGSENNMDALRDPAARWHVSILTAVSAGYVLALPYLGFVLASFVTLCVLLPIFGVRRWYVVLSVAVLTPVIIQQIFSRAFTLMLPRGVLGLPL